jgi:hypothetical protein
MGIFRANAQYIVNKAYLISSPADVEAAIEDARFRLTSSALAGMLVGAVVAFAAVLFTLKATGKL